MRTLLDFENAVLDLFENNRIRDKANNGCHDEVWNSGATIECLVIQGDSNLSGTSKMVKAERHEKKSLSECGKNLYPKSWYD